MGVCMPAYIRNRADGHTPLSPAGWAVTPAAPVVAQRECWHEGDDEEGLPVGPAHHQHAKREELPDDEAHDDAGEQEYPHHAARLVLALVHVAQVVPPGEPGKCKPDHAERQQQRGHDGEGHRDEIHQQHVTHLKAVAGRAGAVRQAPVTVCSWSSSKSSSRETGQDIQASGGATNVVRMTGHGQRLPASLQCDGCLLPVALTCVAGRAADARAAAVVEPVLPHAAVGHAQPQPYEEQRPHGDELHEEVAAVGQGCTQDGGQLLWALDDAVHLLKERTANRTLQGSSKSTKSPSTSTSAQGCACTASMACSASVHSVGSLCQGCGGDRKGGGCAQGVQACTPAGTCCTRPSRRRWRRCGAPAQTS